MMPTKRKNFFVFLFAKPINTSKLLQSCELNLHHHKPAMKNQSNNPLGALHVSSNSFFARLPGLAVVTGVVCVAASVANAAFPAPPAGLNPGDKYHWAFITSTTRDATSTDIADYNTHVQNAANAGSLTAGSGLTWKAIASTATANAKDNAPVTGAIYLLDGVTLVAANSAALWGTHGNPGGVVSLNHAIDLTENNVTVSAYGVVWTGTNPNGTSADGTFTDAEEGGTTFGGPLGTTAASPNRPTYGDPTAAGRHWVAEYADNARTSSKRLYALSEVLTVPATSTPYVDWISKVEFGVAEADRGTDKDPDVDGQNNLVEFALDGHPSSGAATGKTRSRIETVGSEQALVITLPVRGTAPAPTFSGSPPTATVDGVVYTIEGSNNLVDFDQGVTEVTPASAAEMPALDTGWSYRTFRLDGAVPARGAKGFLHVRVAPE
jgi:hypothetical protein